MKEQINTPTRTTTQTNSGVCELEQIKEIAQLSGHMTEKTCNSCIHFGACSKWTDFPKQCGVPVCASFAQQGEWISVEDRMPDRPGEYLVYTWNGHILMCNCCDYLLDGDLQFDNYNVTHWMPLPEPPKGE